MKVKLQKFITLSLAIILSFQSVLSSGALAANDSRQEVDLQEQVTHRIPYHLDNNPNRIVNTVNGDTKSRRGFSWFTTDLLRGSNVRVSKDSQMKENVEIFPAQAEAVGSYYFPRIEEGEDKGKFSSYNPNRYTEYNYKAIAKDLEPGTQYYYQEGSDKGGYSPVGTFKTSGQNGEKFDIIHYTDTQVWYGNQHNFDESWYSQDTLREALEIAPQTNLVVHTGDIVEFSDLEDEWYDLFEQSKDHFSKVTLAPVPGNHDEYSFVNKSYSDDVNFNKHFNVPSHVKLMTKKGL